MSGIATDLLGQSVAELPGVGVGRASRLAKLGIHTFGDLLWHSPRRYEDRNQPYEARALVKGDIGTVAGTIVASSLTGDAVLDEDDMVSDSETHLATQQSIKAYIDTKQDSDENLPKKALRTIN